MDWIVFAFFVMGGRHGRWAEDRRCYPLGRVGLSYEHTYDARRNLIINSPADPGLQ
jgi:hypothetical protein